MKRVDADDFGGSLGPLFESPAPDGPFANSKVPPSPTEVTVAALIWGHRGRVNPISIATLKSITRLSEREIKSVVEQLVVTHRIRIGARRGDPVGYFVVVDKEDQAAAVATYKAQVISMWRRLRVLETGAELRELLGQLRIEE